MLGKRNEAKNNAQPCVVCKGEKVTVCSICQGTGSDPYASLVKGVREMTGEVGGDSKDTILVEVRIPPAAISTTEGPV